MCVFEITSRLADEGNDVKVLHMAWAILPPIPSSHASVFSRARDSFRLHLPRRPIDSREYISHIAFSISIPIISRPPHIIGKKNIKKEGRSEVCSQLKMLTKQHHFDVGSTKDLTLRCAQTGRHFFLRERIMGYLNVCLLVFFLALPCNAAYYEERKFFSHFFFPALTNSC